MRLASAGSSSLRCLRGSILRVSLATFSDRRRLLSMPPYDIFCLTFEPRLSRTRSGKCIPEVAIVKKSNPWARKHLYWSQAEKIRLIV